MRIGRTVMATITGTLVLVAFLSVFAAVGAAIIFFPWWVVGVAGTIVFLMMAFRLGNTMLE